MAIAQSDILKLILQQKANLEAQDLERIKRLIETYQQIYRRLQGDIDALVLAIEKAGGEMTRGQMIRLTQYKRLMDDVAAELAKYSSYVEIELSAAARAAITRAGLDTQQLLGLELAGTGIETNLLKVLWPEAIEKLLGYLDTGGPLMQRLSGLPGFTAEQVAQAILQGVGLGKNPLTIGKEITKAFGMSLTDSMRMMRTVQLYSYREATRANLLANSNVVKGWIWYAELDSDTCMSCVNEHGTFHTLDETLNDHHNGRCSMLPVTYTMDQDNVVPVKGEQWFKEQPEATQRAMMGKEKYDAWSAGAFELKDISKDYHNDIFGEMKGERPLWDLLGAEPPTGLAYATRKDSGGEE